MPAPTDRRYLDSHEWHKLHDDGTVTIGISEFAVDELTDITYLEIANQDGDLAAGDSFGEIESVKATSDLYCGIDGKVIEVNQAAVDDPETINRDCFGDGWMIKVQPSDPAQLDALMDAAAYEANHG
ncbi:MAG: glycine cleavage system protein GcvH [Planctomycetota bacterium]